MTATADYTSALTKGVRHTVARALGRLDPAAFEALMGHLFQFADQTFKTLATKDPPRREIACKEGCTYCCHLYVQVTPLEVIRIVQGLRARLEPNALTAVTARIAAAERKVRGKDSAYRTVLALPCPLLADGRCSVYADRPFVCRGANSADVAACRAGLGTPDGAPLPTYMHQRNVYAAVGQGVAHGLTDARQRTNLVELIQGLHLALQHADPLAAWQSGALDFAPARCVEGMNGKRVV